MAPLDDDPPEWSRETASDQRIVLTFDH